MRRITKKIAAMSAAVVMAVSGMSISAGAFNLTKWDNTSGGIYQGYLYTWINGGTALGTPLTVMGNSTVEAYTQHIRSSSYKIRGVMIVNTYVEGASGPYHDDATNCDSMTVHIGGTTYVNNPEISSSNNFRATSRDCGHISVTVSVHAND